MKAGPAYLGNARASEPPVSWGPHHLHRPVAIAPAGSSTTPKALELQLTLATFLATTAKRQDCNHPRAPIAVAPGATLPFNARTLGC